MKYRHIKVTCKFALKKKPSNLNIYRAITWSWCSDLLKWFWRLLITCNHIGSPWSFRWIKLHIYWTSSTIFLTPNLLLKNKVCLLWTCSHVSPSIKTGSLMIFNPHNWVSNPVTLLFLRSRDFFPGHCVVTMFVSTSIPEKWKSAHLAAPSWR